MVRTFPGKDNFVELELPAALDFHNRINVVYLKPYRSLAPQTVHKGILPHTITDPDGSTQVEWSVEELVGHQEMIDKDRYTYHYVDGTPYLEYLVRWARFPDSDFTWETQELFLRQPNVVDNYHSLQELDPLIWDRDFLP